MYRVKLHASKIIDLSKRDIFIREDRMAKILFDYDLFFFVLCRDIKPPSTNKKQSQPNSVFGYPMHSLETSQNDLRADHPTVNNN